jgi:hypothetical protein
MKPQTIKEVNIFDADILDKIEEVSILLKEYFAIDNKMLPKRIWSTFFEKDSLTSEKNSECLELAKFVRFIKLCGGENNHQGYGYGMEETAFAVWLWGTVHQFHAGLGEQSAEVFRMA